jgi:hypothetical protein
VQSPSWIRQARRDWWLTLLAEGEALNPAFLATLHEPEQTVRKMMSSPVITVDENTELPEIANLLIANHIKRVPVVRDGRVVGVVSRDALVRAAAAAEAPKTISSDASELFGQGIEDQFARLHGHHARGVVVEPSAVNPSETRLTVTDFRALVADHDHRDAQGKSAHERARAARRRRRVAELIEQHISDKHWRQLIHQARLAAERGERQFKLLQFPSALCSDAGRSINSEQSGWARTLRGEAAELYLHWERDLKPQGFPITARVLDFPGGIPGDIGLSLNWAE